jgi:predicted ATPase
MLSKLRVQHYKSLFDTTVDLEPLTIFIGPNGSGKSNICEAVAVLSNFLQRVLVTALGDIVTFFEESLRAIINSQQSLEAKFWYGELDSLLFELNAVPKSQSQLSKNPYFDLFIGLKYLPKNFVIRLHGGDPILHVDSIYQKDFFATEWANVYFTTD